jgi:hypothetical protein
MDAGLKLWLFANTDSYDKGRKLSKLAEETSHLESDESETVVKRKRKPVIHSDDGDGEVYIVNLV